MTDKKIDKTAPMDPGAREVANPTAAANSQRVCYAIETLVAEVRDLFPETSAEYSNYDGRNTALDVTFDLSLVEPDSTALGDLLLLTQSDRRVHSVIVEDGIALVAMVPSARTQDIRDSFGLAEAWDILAEDDDSEFGSSL